MSDKPDAQQRKEGHSALRAKNGVIEKFDPHPADAQPTPSNKTPLEEICSQLRATGDGFLDGVADVLEYKERALAAKGAELAAAKDFVKSFMAWYPDCAQLLDGWHSDGTSWSEWDTSVRNDLRTLGDVAEGILK